MTQEGGRENSWGTEPQNSELTIGSKDHRGIGISCKFDVLVTDARCVPALPIAIHVRLDN